MSYTVQLLMPDRTVCTTLRHSEGAIFCIGGSDLCEMRITGNYSRIYPIRSIAGRTGAETAAELIGASAVLGTDADADYWAPTPGNVGATLAVLGAWAFDNPEAVWKIIG